MKKPSWAFSIWSDSDWIYAELPNINGHQSHTVKVKPDVKGIAKLIVLAKARDANSQLGSKGEPTQAQIDKPTYDPKMVRRVGRQKIMFTQDQRSAARDLVRKWMTT